MTVSAVMIARNESAVIGDAITSVLPVADEVIVLDAGSSDETVHVAAASGARVERSTRWTADIREPFHFADARNEAMGFASGDWILSFDCDERLVCPITGNLLDLLSDAHKAAIRMLELCVSIEHSGALTCALTVPVDAVFYSWSPRLFRRERAKWQYRCHELPMPLTPTGQVPSGICAINHLRRTNPTVGLERNRRLLELQMRECAAYDDPMAAYVKTAMDLAGTLQALGEDGAAYGYYHIAQHCWQRYQEAGTKVAGLVRYRLAWTAQRLGLPHAALIYAAEAFRYLPGLRAAAMVAASAAMQLHARETAVQWAQIARDIKTPMRLETYEGQDKIERDWLEQLLGNCGVRTGVGGS